LICFTLQECKYRDAIRYYQPLIARNANNLLGVTAIVLANLCVSYIMTSQVGCTSDGVVEPSPDSPCSLLSLYDVRVALIA
jgi:hypothetical protein